MKQGKHNCKEELRKHSLKATPSRLAVLNLLEATNNPIDVATIFEYVKKQRIDADPATIFRIINILTEHGIAKQIHLGEGKFRYEYAAKAEHHHLVCMQCGDIEDISDCPITTLEKAITKKKQFIIKKHALEFFGVCKQCQR